jgi:hypothetical protein
LVISLSHHPAGDIAGLRAQLLHMRGELIGRLLRQIGAAPWRCLNDVSAALATLDDIEGEAGR